MSSFISWRTASAFASVTMVFAPVGAELAPVIPVDELSRWASERRLA